MVFGARNWWFDGSSGDLALVGERTDIYRTFHNDYGAHAGEQALLSPDGHSLAAVGEIVDLDTGATRRLPDIGDADAIPAAWTPDGKHLAVIATHFTERTYPDGITWPTPDRATLHLVDVTTNTLTYLADLATPEVFSGLTVAVAPDGRRLAYQSGSTIAVTDLDGQKLSQFSIPADTRIAGKGAWTPDGQALTLLTATGCCAGDAYPMRWQLRTVNPDNGAPILRSMPTAQPGLAFVRLLGWTPDGAAVVAAGYPDPQATPLSFTSQPPSRLTDYNQIRSVAVLALSAAEPPRTLVSAPDDQALNIDIADSALHSAIIRVGQPPTGLGPYAKILIAAVPGALAVVVLAILLMTRPRPRRSRTACLGRR